MQFSAVIIGATGLVGHALTQLMLADARISGISVFTRRATGLSHQKLTEHIIDFESEQEWKHLVKGDILFSALGTTLRAAGSKEAQYKVDFGYQYAFARAASGNGVPRYVLCSSSGADAASRFFYLRMKGELEDAVLKLGFEHVGLIRPGQLEGTRGKARISELIMLQVMHFLNTLHLFRKYRPASENVVAKAMLQAGLDPVGSVDIRELDEVHALSTEYQAIND